MSSIQTAALDSSGLATTNQNELYAYTVFNTSKNNIHYNVIKKCVDFKKYVTHKLKIDDGVHAPAEYTFLRLAYSKPYAYDGGQWVSLGANLGWTSTTSTNAKVSQTRDIDTIIEGGQCQSIVGTSLYGELKTILDQINHSVCVTFDGTTFYNAEGLTAFIHQIMDEIYKVDPVLLISLFICPREYFSVSNYEDYFIYFIHIIKDLGEKTLHNEFCIKYHLDLTILAQVSKVFGTTIKSDYLFLSTKALVEMLNFIIDVRINTEQNVVKGVDYVITNTNSTIKITGTVISDTNSDEFRYKQIAINDGNNFMNPYTLIELLQYINFKLISENKKPIKLVLEHTESELYSFTQKSSQEYDRDFSSIASNAWIQQIGDGYSLYNDAPYNTSRQVTVKYNLMSKVLTNKQKNAYVMATLDNLVKNISLGENDVLPSTKYGYGACFIKTMLTDLFNDNLKTGDTALNLVIDNFATGKESRAEMILRLYNAMRDTSRLSAQVLKYLTSDDIKNTKTFDLINSYVNCDSSFTIDFFTQFKSELVFALKTKYNLSDKINDEQLFSFYLYTHCPEFSKKEFITAVTDAIVAKKKNGALNDILDTFFRQRSSNVLAFLDELKSQLMKDLFINIYNLKCSQQMFIYAMSDDMSKSNEVGQLIRFCLPLATVKSLHYNTCVALLETAFKSTNSFRDKIIQLLKENATDKIFKPKNNKINNDARIALFADLLRALSKSFLTSEEQCKIANQYDNRSWDPVLPYGMTEISDVMKAINLVPECTPEITVFYTEKYLQEH